MILRILLIAPDAPGLDAIPEVRAITSLHQVTVLTGPVTVRDIYQQARTGCYQALHFAGHSFDEVVRLSDKEALSPDDVAQIGKIAGAELVFFNSCRSGLLANYAVRHGLGYAIYCNADLPDHHAWKLASAFYDFVADQTDGTPDYAAAFFRADSGQGQYGLALSPLVVNCWQTILDQLKGHSADIGKLRGDMDRFMFGQRVVLALLGLTTVLAIGGMVIK